MLENFILSNLNQELESKFGWFIWKFDFTVMESLLVVICNNNEEMKLFLHKYSADCDASIHRDDFVEEAMEPKEDLNDDEFEIENSIEGSDDENMEEYNESL